MYACDDTNIKGQGRRYLQASGMPVYFNRAVESNLRVNRLFYSAVHFLTQLNRSPSGISRFGLRYVVGSLESFAPQATTRDDEGRVQLHFPDTSPGRTHEALIEPRAPFSLAAPPSSVVDVDRVLFLNQLNIPWLASYMEKYRAWVHSVPGTIVCSDGLDNLRGDDRQATYLQKLRDSGVRVFTDVLRRDTEISLAVQALSGWRLMDRANELVAFARGTKGYTRAYGGVDDILPWLTRLSETNRVSLLFAAGGEAELLQFLTRASEQRIIGRRGSLAKTSFKLYLIAEADENSSDTLRRVSSRLAAETLSAQFSLERHEAVLVRPSTARLNQELAAGRLDPIVAASEATQAGHSWRERQAAGIFLSLSAKHEGRLFRERILDQLPLGYAPVNLLTDAWRRACSLLNAIEHHGRPSVQADAVDVLTQLAEFGSTLGTAAEEHLPSVDSPLIDLLWRYAAAAYAIARSDAEADSLFPAGALRGAYRKSPFLAKELVFYASRSPIPELAARHSLRILAEGSDGAEEQPIEGFATRLARVSATWTRELWDATAHHRHVLLPGRSLRVFNEERARCLTILGEGLPSIIGGRTFPKAFNTYLFLRTARKEGKNGLVGAVDDTLRHVLETQTAPPQAISWRGDKAVLARLVLSEFSFARRIPVLLSMAGDEDETIRWAALVLAMDRDLREALLAGKPERAARLSVRTQLAKIVERAVGKPRHYWLDREFVSLFAAEHAAEAPGGTGEFDEEVRFSLEDFPRARAVFSEPEGRHPEVAAAIAAARKRCKKVTLVLPPLPNEAEAAPPATTSSTPPLGLGSIASYLSSQGHDVSLMDCHRFPEHVGALKAQAAKSDLVCFGVVHSTYESTRNLTAQLAGAAADRKPVLVLGGQAVTLAPSQFLHDPGYSHIDYLVRGDGERPLAALLAGLGGGKPTRVPGLVPVRDTPSPLPASYELSTEEWHRLPWIDRRLFVDDTGKGYEPTATRDGRTREAHVVVSRGCGWSCGFCTEAVARPGGETRRKASDVLDEIRWLLGAADVSRVQFVDDNVFPQAAVPRRNDAERTEATKWVQAFLTGLAAVRRWKRRFGWRGIVRLEDFVLYEESIPGFIKLLSASGCGLLAFGVEYGDEERRRRAKGGSVTNEQIGQIVNRLWQRRIATKGYFLIGGPGESSESTDTTIRFAVKSGFSLACFALYKNFRGLIRQSGGGGIPTEAARRAATARAKRLLSFQQMSPDLEGTILAATSQAAQRQLFGRAYVSRRMDEAKTVLAALRSLGFSFRDIFKYNDFHSDPTLFEDSDGVWQSAEDDPQEDFRRAVRRAYFEFYARRPFITVYQRLVDAGY